MMGFVRIKVRHHSHVQTGYWLGRFIKVSVLTNWSRRSKSVYTAAVGLYITVATVCTTKISIKQFYVLPTHRIYVFCVDLRTNSDYFPIQH
jgi:hypothetical protein